MNKLLSYKKSMGKHRQFSGSALTHRFKVIGNPSNPRCLGICKYYGNTMEIFCRKPYHTHDVVF